MFVSQFYVYICIYLNFLVHSSGSSSIPSCSALQCVAVYCSVLQLCCSVCCIVFLSLSLALSLSLSRSLSLFLSRSLTLSLSHSLFLPPLNTEVHQLFKFVRVYSKGQICIHIRVICRIHMCGTTRLYVWHYVFTCVIEICRWACVKITCILEKRPTCMKIEWSKTP